MQMPPKHHKKRTAKQKAASARWAAAGRRAAKRKRHGKTAHQTPAQKAANAKWASAGRRARSARLAAKTAGKVYKPPKRTLQGYTGPLAGLPACATIAVADHLAAWTGAVPAESDIAALHSLGNQTISSILDLASRHTLAGYRVADYWKIDSTLPGCIAGLTLPNGLHAAFWPDDDMFVSWGGLQHLSEWSAIPDGESWWVVWSPVLH